MSVITELDRLAELREQEHIWSRTGTGWSPRGQPDGNSNWRRGEPFMILLVDAGGGVFETRGRAGIAPAGLGLALLTHTHIDHTGGLAPVVFSAFMDGRTQALTVVGPPAGYDQPGCRRFMPCCSDLTARRCCSAATSSGDGHPADHLAGQPSAVRHASRFPATPQGGGRSRLSSRRCSGRWPWRSWWRPSSGS